MWGSAAFYLGVVLAAAGLGLAVKPIRRLRVAIRTRGLAVAAAGVLVAGIGLVLATSAAASRRFAAYWRVIYPGSAIIRRMWLRAIEQRATRR